MKIAFLLTGQPRFYEETFPYIKEKILDRYDCDVYAHAWWSLEEIDKQPFQPSWSLKYPFSLDKNFIDKFKNFYNPKNFIAEPSLIYGSHSDANIDNFLKTLQELYPSTSVDKYIRGEMIAPMHKFISVERVYDLVNWENNYDWIIFWRYDGIPKNFPNLHQLEKNKLHAYSDYWNTFGPHRTDLMYPYFIDNAWILDAKFKEILKIAKFYTDCMNDKIETPICTSRLVSAEDVWAACTFYNKISICQHPYEMFTIDINRG